MTKPPAGSSLLFGALAESGQINQRKNGSYRMVLNGVNEIDWFTDRPERVEGIWKPQQLLRKWDNLFANSEPNTQATFEIDGNKETLTFEMFKPRIKSSRMMFKITPFSNFSRDKITGVKGNSMDDISLFIDSGNVRSKCSLAGAVIGQNSRMEGVNLDNCDFRGAKIEGVQLDGASLRGADFRDMFLGGVTLANADLTGAIFNEKSRFGAIVWKNTICPDGTKSAEVDVETPNPEYTFGIEKCTQAQLMIA